MWAWEENEDFYEIFNVQKTRRFFKQMKALILAAGYGTRLMKTARGSPHEELINKTPKALLPLPLEKNGMPLVEYYHLNQLKAISDVVSQVCIVANSYHPFRKTFECWEAAYRQKTGYQDFVRVFYEESISNDTRLGAIGCIKFVLDRAGLDDYIILAGDMLSELELSDLEATFRKYGDTAVAVDLKDEEKIKERYGNLKLDSGGKVVEFIEKPVKPISTLASVPFYVFSRDSLQLIDTYLAEGNNPDAPGYFLAWLIRRRDVHCFVDKGRKLDIGSYEDYLETSAYLRKK